MTRENEKNAATETKLQDTGAPKSDSPPIARDLTDDEIAAVAGGAQVPLAKKNV